MLGRFSQLTNEKIVTGVAHTQRATDQRGFLFPFFVGSNGSFLSSSLCVQFVFRNMHINMYVHIYRYVWISIYACVCMCIYIEYIYTYVMCKCLRVHTMFSTAFPQSGHVRVTRPMHMHRMPQLHVRHDLFTCVPE